LYIGLVTPGWKEKRVLGEIAVERGRHIEGERHTLTDKHRKGTKCHAKTMMSRKADKTLKGTPSMCRLGRMRRGKDEGRV
jgi:hypothetical protein